MFNAQPTGSVISRRDVKGSCKRVLLKQTLNSCRTTYFSARCVTQQDTRSPMQTILRSNFCHGRGGFCRTYLIWIGTETFCRSLTTYAFYLEVPNTSQASHSNLGQIFQVGCLLKVQAPPACISGTSLLRQMCVLPYWEQSCRSNLLCHPVTICWQRASHFQHWHNNAGHPAE